MDLGPIRVRLLDKRYQTYIYICLNSKVVRLFSIFILITNHGGLITVYYICIQNLNMIY